jgi:hypothetical protein
MPQKFHATGIPSHRLSKPQAFQATDIPCHRHSKPRTFHATGIPSQFKFHRWRSMKKKSCD